MVMCLYSGIKTMNLSFKTALLLIYPHVNVLVIVDRNHSNVKAEIMDNNTASKPFPYFNIHLVKVLLI